MDPRGSFRQGVRESTHPRHRRRRRRHGCNVDEDLGGSASDRRLGHHRRSGPRQHGHAVNMGKSSRSGGQHPSNNPVADWLAGIPPHEPKAPSVQAGHKPRGRDRGRDENPSRRDAERKAASQDPRHARPKTHSHSPRPGCIPPQSSHRHHHVKQRSSPDSASRGSLFGVGQSAARRPQGTRSASISDETLSSEPTPGMDAPPPYPPSPELAPPSLGYVSQRPRRKVRHDKYETKRAKRERSQARDELPPEKPKKTRKTGRKHALASSKNVMNNWRSEAVLNDRITVQQPLGPGLFKNGREAASDDLAFSPMNFLRVSRERTCPKSLSEKRLRELERQQQEVEEETRFFAASKEVETAQKPDFHRKDRPSNTIQGISNRRLVSTNEHKARNLTRFSPTLSKPGRYTLRSDDPCSTSPRHPSPHGSVCVGGQQSSRASRASRAPTYISWSSSYSQSLPTPEKIQSPSPRSLWRGNSPGANERAMMETGIFRGTGVRDYGVENSEERTPDTIGRSDCPGNGKHPSVDEGSISTSPSVPTPRGRRRADPLTNSRATRCTQSRERGDSPHEPRQPGRRKAKGPPLGPTEPQSFEGTREADISDGKEEAPRPEECAVSESEARLNYAREARLDTRSKTKHKGQATANGEAEQPGMLPGDDSNRTASDAKERDSPRSRDVMPPPPLPATKPCKAQMDTTSREYPDDCNARRTDNEERTPVTAYERAGRGFGETDADPTATEKCGTAEDYQNIDMRTGGVILPLQSVSWIHPASRPVTPSLTYNTQAPGISRRPASFAGRLTSASEYCEAETELTAPREAEESIAEFITRIESEAEAGMSELMPYDAANFENQDPIGLDTIEDQQVHYEASETQAPHTMGEQSWDPTPLYARESEAYKGNFADPYTKGWEIAPEEQDLTFTWDPYRYRRY